MNTENCSQEVKQIFLGLPGGIGDLVIITPILEELKKKNPQAKIIFGVGDVPFRWVVELNPNIDQIISPFGIESDPEKLAAQKRQLEQQYDRVVLFHFPKDPVKLRRKLRQWLEKRGWILDRRHLIERYAALAEIELKEKTPKFYYNEADQQEAERFLKKVGVTDSDRVIVLSHTVGNSTFLRNWPLECFEQLMKFLLLT